ncbi:chemotaxis protein CheW [Halopiger goleimassiliensis]|uniref:chemotaxis protein CheW n=1 Tax=Halopiger goleimassiliensis TaxID=1293048 RepID=UPI000677A9EA|nr:chemotaxis protein CheW [Halopiger goleimassiliensis]
MTTTSDRSNVDDDRETLSLLTFFLAGDRYCVRLASVDSVVGVESPDSLEAAADPWNAGTVSIDGTSVRVVDLPRVVASPSASVERPAEAALLVLDDAIGETARFGWLVDDIGDTETVRPDEVESTLPSAQIVRGRLDLESGPALLLDEQAIHA